jgi:hypothetical protein
MTSYGVISGIHAIKKYLYRIGKRTISKELRNGFVAFVIGKLLTV